MQDTFSFFTAQHLVTYSVVKIYFSQTYSNIDKYKHGRQLRYLRYMKFLIKITFAFGLKYKYGLRSLVQLKSIK